MEKLKAREEIDSKLKWRLADIYETEDLWQNEFDDCIKSLVDLAKFQGTLSNGYTLLDCLKLCHNISLKVTRLYSYATMKHHEDMDLPKYQALHDKANGLNVKFGAASSFIEPEILTISEEKIKQVILTEPVYKHYLIDLLRGKAHILSNEMEELLANASEIAGASDTTFSMLTNTDMNFGTITDENGNTVELTRGRFMSFLQSKDRRVREEAFKGFYKQFLAHKNTLAATLSGSVKGDVFFARTRKYPSALHASLFQSNIDKAVYTNLIKVVNDNLHLMHKYIKLRKERLGVDELHMYDLYTPIVLEADTSVSFEDAKNITLKALAPMGLDYMKVVEHGFENNWIDVYETPNKRASAYSWGLYGTHPFILLNFDDTISDMFTLAHEIGHAVHSHYTDNTQPFIYGSYSTFVAEVASTVNEALLCQHLLNTLTDKTQLNYITNHFLEQFRTTLFRQTMFAEFELITHEMVESDEALTVETLCKIYHDLNVKYYGPDIVVDSEIDMEWARIPHFYDAFYVFQYATGMSASLAFADKILKEGESAVTLYTEFLKSGCSDYPIEVLKKAGVDMSSSEPIEAAMKKFGELIDKMIQL